MGRGSSKAGGGGGAAKQQAQSISGKPFDPKDPLTWAVGQKIEYHPAGDAIDGNDNTWYEGEVVALHPDSSKGFQVEVRTTAMHHPDGNVYTQPGNQLRLAADSVPSTNLFAANAGITYKAPKTRRRRVPGDFM